ncbi:PQQ-dependent sugar dehydrogenase [Streptomyces sp. TRM43335]|uniref:PQQ-dependent sugar dehydrogenase n=1 Tax=Streptomyces taklimakanensis TaxID=2569853 RepID=A0A6G2BFS4_9ACTN|nr:PQQ-dependent sugar dehydrogenase [Streptomyces taklimakanensis]MTE21137.1 PQQ-dependent sugar dehydrogenase [Streptomyces taklimakanensis]
MLRSRSHRPRAAVASLAGLALLAAGCSGGDSDPAGSPSATTDRSSAASSPSPGASAAPAEGSAKVVDTVATDLESPWGLAPLPDGDLLVSSRDEATISRVDVDSGEVTELGTVPGVDPGGEGGLLGIAVSPDFAEDHHVYAYFTSASDNRIVRMLHDEDEEPGDRLGAPSTVLRGIPKGVIHNGGRIAFGPDRMLYAGTGDTGDESLAQDRDSLGGKILRMTPEGEPPDHGNPEADSVVYSWGHRNVQGLAWDAEKRLWASEFGQDTWDELNLIRPGGNYGWPEVEGEAGEEGFVDPVAQWKPAEASPSGIAVAEGSVWMAGLRGERLWRIPLKGEETVADPQAFLEGEYGRLRTVVSDGGDGLWLVTNETDSRGTPEEGDDRILKLEVR